MSGPRVLRACVLLFGAGLAGVLVPAASGAPQHARPFVDSAFGWRDVSGPDLHAALARKRWARVVVALRPAAKALGDGASKATSTVQARVLRTLGAADFRLGERWRQIPAFAGLVSRTGLAGLTADPDVVRVDLDVGGRATDTESLPLIHGDTAHSEGFLGAGATVAVLDSGVEADHPDLAGRVADQHCFCANPDGTGCCHAEAVEAGGDGSAADDNGHGTNVAGIIASAGITAPQGVAPGAKIVAVKVLAADGSFSNTAQIISALTWVMENHPEVKIVNLSLGTSALFPDSCDSATAYTLALASAIDTFQAHGGLVFVSAGNGAEKAAMAAPACVRSAVAVGAVYDSDLGTVAFPTANCTDTATGPDRVACFSNSSPALDLLAPGAMITSTGIGSGVSTYAGTSQACPQAAGAAAVLLAASPGLSGAAIETALESSGRSVTDSANGRSTPRVDVAAALASVGAGPPVSAPPVSGPPPPVVSPPASAGEEPHIQVAPARLAFRPVRAHRFVVREVTIRNVGEAALQVDPPARLKQPFGFARYPGSLTVPRGGSVRIKLVFRPASAGLFVGALVIRSDDSTHPLVSIQLSGVGLRS